MNLGSVIPAAAESGVLGLSKAWALQGEHRESQKLKGKTGKCNPGMPKALRGCTKPLHRSSSGGLEDAAAHGRSPDDLSIEMGVPRFQFLPAGRGLSLRAAGSSQEALPG